MLLVYSATRLTSEHHRLNACVERSESTDRSAIPESAEADFQLNSRRFQSVAHTAPLLITCAAQTLKSEEKLEAAGAMRLAGVARQMYDPDMPS